MERLTKKVDGVWTALCKYESSPFPVVTQEIIDRLAAYEDTALTPEEVQTMRWIPVEERLPEKRKTVLALRDVSGYKNSRRPSPVMVACLDDWGASQFWMEYDCETRECEEIECGVTHWMPLPKAPKEEKKDD